MEQAQSYKRLALVVEDDPVQRETIVTLLEGSDMDVIQCESGEAAEMVLELAGRSGAAADPVVRQQLGALVAEGMAVSLLDLQAVLAQLRGADPGPLAAVRKLTGVAHRQAAAEAALELAGPDGAAADGGGPGGGALHDFLLTRCLSIAGGTTQILLSLVAERLLGLPREEAR